MHRPVRVLAAVVAAVGLAGPVAAQQQPPTTPTTAPVPEPTAPATSPEPPLPDTVTPSPDPVPARPGSGPGGPAVPQAASAQESDVGGGALRRGEVPADARRLMRSIRRSAPNSTRRLLGALSGLELLGIDSRQAVALGFGRFPVGGFATFSHDWLFPRYVPTFHLHKGTDIFAVAGTPVRSPADGTLKLTRGAVGGLAAYVYQRDGTYYYLAHLRGFVTGQRSGQQVKVGEVVGYVGATGNAAGGAPHVHFEIHPAPSRTVTSGSGASRTATIVTRPVPVGTVLPAVDPKAYLDQWLTDALAGVSRLLGSTEARPRALLANGVTRRGADAPSVFAAPVTPPLSQLLWASAASPPGGALALAEAEGLKAAAELDWDLLTFRRHARLEAEQQAAVRTIAILDPLTPAPLRRSGNEG